MHLKLIFSQYLSLSLQSYHVEALLQEDYLAEVHVLQKQLGRSLKSYMQLHILNGVLASKSGKSQENC